MVRGAMGWRCAPVGRTDLARGRADLGRASGVAVRTLVLLAAVLGGGCASQLKYEDMRERAQRAEARVAEAERYIAGVQDDNAMLQRSLIEQANYIYMLERGAVWQANEMARIVDTCSI